MKIKLKETVTDGLSTYYKDEIVELDLTNGPDHLLYEDENSSSESGAYICYGHGSYVFVTLDKFEIVDV